MIGQQEILKYGDTNVFDVLKRVPGMTVVGESIRMRGLGNGYTQVLVNGEPPPGFTPQSVSFDFKLQACWPGGIFERYLLIVGDHTADDYPRLRMLRPHAFYPQPDAAAIDQHFGTGPQRAVHVRVG